VETPNEVLHLTAAALSVALIPPSPAARQVNFIVSDLSWMAIR
jgi:hypothetical protein